MHACTYAFLGKQCFYLQKQCLPLLRTNGDIARPLKFTNMIDQFLKTTKIYQENLVQHRKTHEGLREKLKSISNVKVREELLDFYEVSDMLHSQASMNLIVAEELLLDKS